MLFKDIVIRDANARKKIIQIIFEDQNILVINKPAGLPVIPDRWDENRPNLLQIFNLKYQEISKSKSVKFWVVHRIDSDTSGLVLFAKNTSMHRKLSLAFENKQVEKTYLAIVKGSPPKSNGRIEFALSVPKKGRVSIDPNGKPAVTTYKILERFNKFSLVEVYPETGRTHQIRVHLKAIGHALAVDPIYSGFSRLGIEHLKRVRSLRKEQPVSLISRVSLHAYKLEVSSGDFPEEYRFMAAIPKDMMAALKALRKWDSPRKKL
jgi:23S rRNA pseudouridine955/2504/2580 synthase/23S rRNA pseudouridine1911/1915/1917 synthase